MTRTSLLSVLLGLALFAGQAGGQSAADSAAVIAVAKDYIDGFLDRDTTRLRRALHPELVKRQVLARPNRPSDELSVSTTEGMISSLAGRKRNPASEHLKSDVQVLHMFGNMATVMIDVGPWIDYLHVARWNGEYKIFNIMFDFRRP